MAARKFSQYKFQIQNPIVPRNILFPMFKYKIVPPHFCTERCGIRQTEAKLKPLVMRCS